MPLQISHYQASPLIHNIPQNNCATLVKEAIKSLVSAQFSDFCGKIVEIINMLTKTYGEKLTCSQLNRELDTFFNPQSGWKAEALFDYGGSLQTGYRSKQLNGTTYLITAPAHDLLEENTVTAQLSGGRSAASVLDEIKNSFPMGQIKTLIPIAQTNPLGVFGPRGHFVLCEVDINEGIISEVALHDSKAGLVDVFYQGADRLKEQLLARENLGLNKQSALTAHHHGHQHLFNGNDCGRYALYYASTIVDTDSLANTSTKEAMAFFSQHCVK